MFDDTWLCIEVMNGILKARDLPLLTPDRYRELFDFPVEEYYRRLGFDFAAEPFSVLGTEFIVGYEKRRLECALQPRAEETLRELKALGLEQSVLSAYKQNTLEELIEHFGLTSYFVRLVGLQDHYANGKLENARDCIGKLPCPAEEVVVVGDTLHDHEVAKEIGASCILIAAGHHARERLETTGAPVVDGLTDLAPLLQAS